MSPEKISARKKGEKDQIVPEKADAEELPPGWTKDVKFRKSGSITKKDQFYKDPVTGCIFRSLRDVRRYLKTGEVGKLAIKPKDNSPSDMDHAMEIGEVSGLEANRSEEKEEKSELMETRSSRRKRLLEDGSEGHTKRDKSGEKSKSILPRRVSKRLAGVDVDVPLLPEPKTSPQASSRRSRQGKTSISVDSDAPKEHSKKEKQVNPIEKTHKPIEKQEIPTVSTRASEHDTSNNPIEKQEITISPPENLPSHCEKVDKNQESSPKEHHEGIKIDDKSNKEKQAPATPEKPDSSLEMDNDNDSQRLPNPVGVTDFSLNDLWTDPCIEFAVKTLTGAIPIGDSNKADDFLTTSGPELPLEELWTDPCIEFAVKTLTGAIPLEQQDLCVQDYLHNQPQTPGENNLSLPDICANNLCQTEVLSKHFDTMPESSVHDRQQTTVSQNCQSIGSLQNPGNSVLPQEAKWNGGQCSKPRSVQ